MVPASFSQGPSKSGTIFPRTPSSPHVLQLAAAASASPGAGVGAATSSAPGAPGAPGGLGGVPGGPPLPGSQVPSLEDRSKLSVAGCPVSPKGGRRRSVIAELVNPGGGEKFYEIGRQVASAGPELIWKIYDAQRKSDKRVS
ncbi:hypothetical protein IscW_ISCW020541 [Ixodes scapularis]|uniref:Uncharacterized protein n=1 Tax=Ixodes scapularis TaxID=6945 RepID=B7Q145_IXOSC|nr:hypothetical protein IscW_ISCW020541 [Ixodes scapularis]|eukprot:XP_002408918.1 hypothetical protein IscW_ISCW020541 [Ixodes scapularis]